MMTSGVKFYRLTYDNDWGCRSNRRTISWYFTQRMNKKKTLEFLAKQVKYVNESAYEWKKLKLNHPYQLLIAK